MDAVVARVDLLDVLERNAAHVTAAFAADANSADSSIATRPCCAVMVCAFTSDSTCSTNSEERSLFELERRVFEESRITHLENDNARLRADNSKLTSQVSRLGGLIRDLTADTHA